MNKRHLKKIKRRDRLAHWFITVGGVGVIVCVVGMLLLILGTALPLFEKPTIERLSSHRRPAGDTSAVLAAGVDDYRETAFTLDAAGRFHFFQLSSDASLDVLSARPAAPSGSTVTHVTTHGGMQYTLLWSDQTTQLVRVVFKSDFAAERRQIVHRLVTVATFPPLPAPLAQADIREQEDGAVLTGLDDAGRLHVQFRRGDEDATPEPAGTLSAESASDVTAFVLNRDGTTLYAGTRTGELLRWDLRQTPPKLAERVNAFPDHRVITALGLVFGDVSLAIGDDRGEVSTWSAVKLYGPDSDKRLTRIHRLSQHPAPVAGFSFTVHDKSVLSRSRTGTAHLDHMTSERRLLSLTSPVPLQDAQFSLQGDTIMAVDREQAVSLWKLHNPHPEISWRVLFGRVWYENYNDPALVWQSSSANDDNEAKFSFVPLIFGSLKGTLYAMIFAVPLAFFGALYTSQFTTPEIRGFVKPTVEVMAAIPSVVIGFLAALWLAPRIEVAIVPVLLFAFALPVALMLFLLAWTPLRHFTFAKRLERGYEFVVAVPVLLLAVLLAWLAAPWVEGIFFHGDFKQWLFAEAGSRFDQRNSIVIAFALGFAVIPIIFTIAEDAFSNVPNSLKAASLALGASRWQTVWRVVLPSASPGVFAALIVGFGRAIGETMIVLMATGNTPILDASPFNGMRTLSANIAVEIPEAPAGSTLYRTLFLSAVLLFLLTSVLNTAAELIRQHLRKKYRY